MFKRVGREIRVWARVLFILQLIPVVLGGIACGIAGFAYDPDYGVIGILAGILFIVLGYLLVRFGALMLYSWGELVDRAARIDEKLEKMNAPAPVQPAPAPYAAPAYAYAPPVNPAPVVPAAPVKAAPVMSVPVVNVPVKDDPILEDDYTQAVSRPAPVAAEWICPNCGQVNAADGSWCRNCGTKKTV